MSTYVTLSHHGGKKKGEKNNFVEKYEQRSKKTLKPC